MFAFCLLSLNQKASIWKRSFKSLLSFPRDAQQRLLRQACPTGRLLTHLQPFAGCYDARVKNAHQRRSVLRGVRDGCGQSPRWSLSLSPSSLQRNVQPTLSHTLVLPPSPSSQVCGGHKPCGPRASALEDLAPPAGRGDEEDSSPRRAPCLSSPSTGPCAFPLSPSPASFQEPEAPQRCACSAPPLSPNRRRQAASETQIRSATKTGQKR